MRFWKMNGTGNDFILINNMEEKIDEELFPRITRVLCARRISLGADGMMFVSRAHEGVGADFRMSFFNSDGSEGEMCGNGARCIARYGYENSLAGETVTIETVSGLVSCQRLDRSNYRVRLNDPEILIPDIKLDICLGEDRHWLIPCAYMELGDPGLPHLVVMYEKPISALCGQTHLEDADMDILRRIGQQLRNHTSLEKGANVNFVEIVGPNHVYIRTFERGVEDFTYACGTGTVCSACILALKGLVTTRDVSCDMAGGRLSVDIGEMDIAQDKSVRFEGLYLKGSTNVVAKGEITDENLCSKLLL